jgi:putative membrane protein
MIEAPDQTAARPLEGVRTVFGGVLMGLANLVPGISGGTMLLAAGIYPRFIHAVADLTTLRLRRSTLLFLGVVVASAGAAILLGAGPIKRLVVDSRWVMYSLFIGLTLGGVPLVWRLARPVGPVVYAGAVVGLVLMLWLSSQSWTQGGSPGAVLLFLSGTLGAAAMILPGVSGGYLLLILGSYITVLGAIDRFKGLFAGDVDAALGTLDVLGPFALGVVASLVAMSNLLKWLLNRHRQPTLGVLLGLLVGAVVGIWPFQHSVRPADPELAARLEPERWPLETYAPGTGEALIAAALVALGLGATLLIDRLGGGREAKD